MWKVCINKTMYDCTHRRKPLFWVHKFPQWWWRESIRITRGSPTMDCTPTSLYLKTIYCSYMLSWIVILIRFSSKSQCPCHIQCLGRRSQGLVYNLCVRTVATPQPIWTVRIETGDAQFDPKKKMASFRTYPTFSYTDCLNSPRNLFVIRGLTN